MYLHQFRTRICFHVKTYRTTKLSMCLFLCLDTSVNPKLRPFSFTCHHHFCLTCLSSASTSQSALKPGLEGILPCVRCFCCLVPSQLFHIICERAVEFAVQVPLDHCTSSIYKSTLRCFSIATRYSISIGSYWASSSCSHQPSFLHLLQYSKYTSYLPRYCT